MKSRYLIYFLIYGLFQGFYYGTVIGTLNKTEQLMQEIRNRYYHFGGYVFEKNTVHMLILIILIMIFICIVVWCSKEKDK